VTPYSPDLALWFLLIFRNEIAMKRAPFSTRDSKKLVSVVIPAVAEILGPLG
jgi:hypothetical protein